MRNWLFAGLFAVAVGLFSFAEFSLSSRPNPLPPRYGVTFSTLYVQQLGLDVEETYRALVEDLGVRVVRIAVYWSDVEREQGTFDWSMYDRLIEISRVNEVKVTLAVGTKLPRWPECYVPDWAQRFDETYQNKYARSYIKSAVEHFKSSSAIERWQVENEVMFPFGDCAYQLSLEELQERVELIRLIDTRPIQLTVSGELGPWKDEADLADILGISMYRKTWNDTFGYFVYPIGPEFYQIRARLIGKRVDRIILSELQAEPWFSRPIDTYTPEESYTLFTSEQFESNLAFANKSGVSEVYLWGAEWWYYLNVQGDERLWNVARDVFDP